MSKWEMVEFERIFSDCTKEGTKIPKEKYEEYGEYPIIDQGQEFITGFANDRKGIFTNTPVIIFGDHTRIIKYIDFPFFLGADGIKVLKSKINHVDYKYLYYALKNLSIPNTGYNRHYKWLKESQIPLPPLDEQKRIAEELDKISGLIAKRKSQLEKLELLVKARFVEMFREGSFEQKLLNEICIKITDGTHHPPKFVDKGIPFLLVSNIVNNKIVYKTNKFITEEEYKMLIKRTPITLGDILLTTVGSYGNPAVIEKDIKFCFQRHIGYIKPNKDLINSYYLQYFFLSPNGKEQIEFRVKGIAQKTLNLSELKTIVVPLPNLDLQNQFADYVAKVEQTKTKLQHALGQLETLYKARMQEYFE